MSSGYGSLPRRRYSRAKRAAIVAACASVLTGTAMAMPAATFADDAADTPPIVSVDLGGQTVAVPDLGVPLPNVELSTDQLPLAPVTDALDLEVSIDTAPEAAGTEPSTTEPASDVPSDGEQNWRQPDASDIEKARPVSDVPSDDEAARASNGRSTPASAIAGAPVTDSRLTTASPVASQEVARGVLEARTQRQIEQAAAIRAAQVLGTEKSAPAAVSAAVSKDGLGLAAPLTDLGSRAGVDTLNLASRNGPNSATGDWNLLPEVFYAAIPLLLAGAAVIAHGRRNARMTAVSVGVVQRRRHAGK
ncbi:hypothetical protein [Sporichthya sp.]|uniref:hypothetical protein n=1 Tax=Sporichthya sp. TaxID=65475 RepID=UPI0018258665|nr:hypothetical protein [Sporichthya sp.]MBA3742935.1 hypothetical protein [Sporichthya sp.]